MKSRFLDELKKAIKSGKPDTPAAQYHNEIVKRADEFSSKKRTQRSFNVENLMKKMSQPPKVERKTIKERWNNFLYRMDVKFDKFLMSIYHKIPKWKKGINKWLDNLSFKIHRHVYRADYEKMFKIIELMDAKKVNSVLLQNAKSRKMINDEESKYLKGLFQGRVSFFKSNGREVDADPIVEKMLERIEKLPVIDPVKDLTDANPHMMNDAKFLQLLENLKTNREKVTE